MNDQYFTREPESASRPAECTFTWRGRELHFQTDAGVFSRGELDQGTRLLLDALPENLSGDILDLGCGWGPIGISVKAVLPETRVMMTDVNLRALELARGNAKRNRVGVFCVESDGFSALEGKRFDAVITNPPIRAGKQVIYKMFADARDHLNPGGSLFLVIRKQQGAESCMKYLQTLYPSVERLDRASGYWVLEARAEPVRDGGEA